MGEWLGANDILGNDDIHCPFIIFVIPNTGADREASAYLAEKAKNFLGNLS